MPADIFLHVWTLSDLDGNRLLSKSEFCLFMYLMHALRNFGTSFRLPEYITPEQATRLLGLEGAVTTSSQGNACTPFAIQQRLKGFKMQVQTRLGCSAAISNTLKVQACHSLQCSSVGH